MSQVNFCANQGLPRTAVHDMAEIVRETKNVKSFPDLCEKAQQEFTSVEAQYFSPYAISKISCVTDANNQLAAQMAEEAYRKNPPVPYN